MHKDYRQGSLADGLVTQRAARQGFLEEVDALLDWSTLEVMLAPISGGKVGRPGIPPLCLFKILLLQQFFGLSDPEAERQVDDRLSFRRFCGLPLEEPAPDQRRRFRPGTPVRSCRYCH